MMNLLFKPFGLFTFALFMLTVSTVSAQDAAPAETLLIYYEDEKPNRLDFMLLQENICLEAVQRLNPDLDIGDIHYGMQLLMPTNQPCYDYDKSVSGWWNFNDGIPPRLKYYENGRWLDEPYYSDDVVYVRARSVEEIANRYNVCVDDLLAENILLQDFAIYEAFATRTSYDVFIPDSAPPCDPNWVDPRETAQTTQPTPAIEVAPHEVTPTFLANAHQICAEEIYWVNWHFYLYTRNFRNNNAVTLNTPDDAAPCYKAGRRLIYNDAQGRPLERPHYSDMPVYIAAPGATMPDIAEELGVCLIDLLRVNRFPEMPLSVEAEIFIPTSRPCPENIEARIASARTTDLGAVSTELNICPEELLPLNPHFSKTSSSWSLENGIYRQGVLDSWILVPTDATTCYWQYYPIGNESIHDIERKLNVCHEAFAWEHNYVSRGTLPQPIIPDNRAVLYIRHDAQPCYNEAGQRLSYPERYFQNLKMQLQAPEIQYADMPIHFFQRSDTVYKISQQYDVCVPDLLAVNPILVWARPGGHPTFIPDTRPCYDETTGMPLIYEDTAGTPLLEPQIADHLIYYGSQPRGLVSYYYNVCINRIEDANRDKFDRESSYLGWIIPTDRPPCYDDDGIRIHYVCYNQPVDFDVDYRQNGQPLSFDIDGAHCYDIAQSETIVWYRGEPYQIVDYYDNVMLTSRAFTAWCFGVSLDAIDAINDNPDILEILPLYSRAIPRPTRECYIQNPALLDEYNTVHIVQAGETLDGIARQYDKTRSWIATVNDLDEHSTIWAGQMLIIPAGPTMTLLYQIVGGIGILVAAVSMLQFWYNRPAATHWEEMRAEDVISTGILAETENYVAWLSHEPDGKDVYHLELGKVTVLLFRDEWNEVADLLKKADGLVRGRKNGKGK